MDINTYTNQLHERIKTISMDSGSEGDVIRNGQTLREMRLVLEELKQFTLSYMFSNATEEIQFFKEAKPVLLSQYLYHRRIYNLVLFNSFRDHKRRIEHFHRILQKLERFAHKHEHFYEYCITGSTYLDHQYFRRGDHSRLNLHEDDKFTTHYDKLLAQILANEMIKDYVIKSIEHQQ